MAASNMGMSEEDVINMSNEMIQSVLFPFIPVNAEKFADSISNLLSKEVNSHLASTLKILCLLSPQWGYL